MGQLKVCELSHPLPFTNFPLATSPSLHSITAHKLRTCHFTITPLNYSSKTSHLPLHHHSTQLPLTNFTLASSSSLHSITAHKLLTCLLTNTSSLTSHILPDLSHPLLPLTTFALATSPSLHIELRGRMSRGALASDGLGLEWSSVCNIFCQL